MSQPAENPCSAVEECEQVVAAIVQALYKTTPRTFTIEALKYYEDNLNGVIIELLHTLESCMPSKDTVLDNISQARDELGLAIDRLVSKGADRQFNKCLRNCRLYLEEALRIWYG